MSTTIRTKVRFRRAMRRPAPNPKTTKVRKTTDSLARRLALAHYIERLIDQGKIRHYAHAARILRITRARMTQVMDLMLLPMDVQEQILTDGLKSSERELRAIAHRRPRRTPGAP